MIINLTPHPIVIVFSVDDNEQYVTIPPTAPPARVSSRLVEGAPIDGIPFAETVFGEVENLPAVCEHTTYIVSQIVIAACPERADLVRPDTEPDAIRDADGRIVAVRRLTRSAVNYPAASSGALSPPQGVGFPAAILMNKTFVPKTFVVAAGGRAMNNEKVFTVISGPRSAPVVQTVILNGVLANEPLTPKLARRAARVACGFDSQVTVWDDNSEHGYRLYSRSARKLWRDD